MIRTANIEVSLQRLSILRIEHPQANPLKLACTLRAGESLPSGLTVTAEIHTSRNVAAETTPLASSTVTVAADATSFEVTFDSPQTNQTVTPNSTRALWLVLYGVGDADQLYTLAAADLLLGWHAVSTLTADPPATSILIEKGGVAWASGRSYPSGIIVTVGTTAYVATQDHASGAVDEPGVGQEWESVWVVLSGGGGGGATNLGVTTGPSTVTITSSTGTSAIIPAATVSVAGAMTGADKTKLDGIQAGAEVNVNADWNAVSGDAAILNKPTITNGTVTSLSVTTANGVSATVSNPTTTPSLLFALGAITPTSVNGVTIANGGSGALTVTGTASVAGTTSGTNTGDQTITLTGDVTGSGTGSFAATITANAVTYAKMQAVSAASRLLGRGTAGTTAVREISLGTGLSMSGDVLSATATGGGTNTILQFFPRDAEFPATNFATIDTRNNHPCLDFDDTTVETVFFTGFVPQGASFATSGTALTFVIESTATSATSGNIGWSVSLERIVAGGIDIDADNFGTAQSGSGAVNATSGVVTEVSVTFTLAQLPSGLAAGDMIRVRVQRNTSVSGDHTGDAELLGLYANMTPQIP
jgi:hypothetical protein